MNRSEKEQTVEELRETFNQSTSVILVEFTGINVQDVTELRDRIRKAGSQYKVVKNRLALLAADHTPVTELKEHFHGPTAIAFTQNDAVALAKALKEFSRNRSGMTLKAAVVNGEVLSVARVEELAEMPSREALLGKLVYLLNAPLTHLASALQSPLRNLTSGLKQLADQKEE